MDLQVIDRVKPKPGLAYTAGATVEGAAAGFVVSGGELLATAGAWVPAREALPVPGR